MKNRLSVNVGLVLILAGLMPLSAHSQTDVTVSVGARDPAVAPDGLTIAVSIFGKIWLVPIEGGDARQLTFGPGWDTSPAWSPDGRFLVYGHGGATGTDLIERNLVTNGERYLHRGQADIGQVAFSHDGDYVYFVNDLSQYDAHVWRIAIGGGQPEQLTFTQNWHEWSFALKPGGDQVLVESGRYGGADLYEINVNGGPAKRLTSTLAREMSVAVSPNGRQHAYVETHNGVDHVVVVDETTTKRISTSPFDQKQLVFHPDGESLVLVAGRQLFRVRTQDGETTPIPFTAQCSVADHPIDELVITNVQLFDAVGGDVVPEASIVIRDGRIAEVHSKPFMIEGLSVPVIDGEGRTLLPGLVDNHHHFWSPLNGPGLLANGVTSIRDPGSAIADALDYKDAIRLGILAGPDVYTAGPLIDGPGGYHPMVDVSIDDPAAAPELVRTLKAQGVDLLKVYFQLDLDVLQAVVAEAAVQGLPVTGHIGVRASWEEGMDAGVNGFSHIRVWRDFLPLEDQVDGRDESLDGTRNPIGRSQADWRDIDPASPEVSALLRRMAETGTALDPTLYIQRVADPELSARDRVRFSIEEYDTKVQSYARMGEFVRLATEAGVLLLAGTDGVPLFNELEAYAAAGVPNVDILKSATVNGAQWLGLEADFGTIEPGKRAHLILVDGDPLNNIEDLREIDLVVKDGIIVFQR